MKNAPERIFADRGPRGGLIYREQRMPDTEAEYVRADIHATLAAENERLDQECRLSMETIAYERRRAENAEAEVERLRRLAMAQSKAIHSPRAEASAAVKVKALSEVEIENALEDASKAAFVSAQSVYRGEHDHFPLNQTWETTSERIREGWRKIAHAAVEAAEMPPLGTQPEPRKRRTISALTTQPAAPQFARNATNDQIAAVMLQHGTDEQRREALAYAGIAQPVAPQEAEAVAWRCKDYADGWVVYGEKSAAERHQRNDGCLMQPLYAHPPTRAAEEAQARCIVDFICDDVLPAYGVASEVGRGDAELFSAVRAALTAALEAGR